MADIDQRDASIAESDNHIAPSKRLPRRRNGQEQACEPCRKAKVKCDHALPTCLKCIRRKKQSGCIYLPAPMSQPKTPRTSERSHSAISLASPPNAHTPGPSMPQTHFTPRSPMPPVETPRSPCNASRTPQEPIAARMSAPDPASGFLHSTGFPTIVKDNLAGNWPISSSDNANAMADMTSEQTSGIRILKLLPDRQTCDALIQNYKTNPSNCFHVPTISHITSSIWHTFGHYLEDPRPLRGLEVAVQEIIRNSSKPWHEPDDYNEWLDTFSGSNLRWEALGIVFVSMAYSCVCLPEDWAQNDATRSMRSFAVELKGCTEMIIGILRKHETINLLVIVLLGQYFHLGTLIHGDTSFTVWREHGDFVSALTALNLHQDDGSSRSPETTTISSQIRRRVFAQAFSMDKMLALFNGRPPCLSIRYCSCPLPLDLTDDAFVHGRDHLMREVRELDDKGWSRKQDSDFNYVTLHRAEVLFCIILDEILEMLIGTREQWSEEKLNDLKVRSDQAYASLPPHLHFSHPDVHPLSQKLSAQGIRLHWSALNNRLEYLRLTFLLERLSIERSSTTQLQSRQKLLDISRAMLEYTVYLWLQRDRFKNKLHDYDYMLMCHGMPSAGILCVELLKSLKQTNVVPGDNVRLPRSEVVQNLSLLVGFLDWVRPSAGNYKLCRRMKQIIQRILDMVLDPNPNQASTSSDAVDKRLGSEQQLGFPQPALLNGDGRSSLLNDQEQNARNSDATYDTSGFGYNGNGSFVFGTDLSGNVGANATTLNNENFSSMLDTGLENLDWLGEVDWTRGPWIDLN